ncbi:hypothetical protein BKA69DRAFT_1036089 [Paraphysoderma sedebokerense]|nr:hypothetical protein BKA69DRAFT_1036089 [Paraphysoderma sedebokerense]
MMATSSSVLIPLRFLATVAHLITAIMVVLTKESNILAALPMSYDMSMYREFDTSQHNVLVIHDVVLNFVSDIVTHSIAALLSCYFMNEMLHYVTYWYIFIFFGFARTPIPHLINEAFFQGSSCDLRIRMYSNDDYVQVEPILK